MKDTYIVLIVGKSGSGKSTLAETLTQDYGLKEVKSYTTRPQRNENDTTHEFITKEEFRGLDICAYTLYNGYEYGATTQQVDECDVYVIDPKGIDYFMTHYNGRKIPMVICIESSERIRKRRMKERGDKLNAIKERIANDEEAFRDTDKYAFRTFINNDKDYNDIKVIAKEIYNLFFRDIKGEIG